MQRKSVKILTILTIASIVSGCPLQLGFTVASSALGAVGSYYSYKAANIDPVQVETLSRDCVFYAYQTVSDDDWGVISQDLRDGIKTNNALAVSNCSAIRAEWCLKWPDEEICLN